MDERIPLSISSDQLALESEMAKRGVDRYRSSVNESASKGRVSITGPGRQLVADSVGGLAKALTKWMKAAKESPGMRVGALKLLDQLRAPDIAAIAVQSMLDASVKAKKRSTTICDIATLLRDEATLKELKRQHAPLFRRLQGFQVPRHMRTTVANRWRKEDLWDYKVPLRTDQMQAGLVVFELAMQTTDLFRVEVLTKRNRPTYLLTLQPGVTEWMEEMHEKREALSPIYLPMVQEPGEWGVGKVGGYRSNMARRKPLCRVQRKGHVDTMRDAEMPHIYRAVNLAQETPWRVNSTVYEVARELWECNAQVAGFPDRDQPELPPKPDEEDEEQMKAWKSTKTDALERYRAEGSARLRHLRTLELAHRFSGKTFWYPHFLDFRARMYPTPAWLNNQGPDFARGLLEFARSSRVEHGSPEAERFEEYGASLYKGPIPDGLIEAVGEDPLSCLAWTKADKPWQFLAWALDAWAWREEEGHPIRVPVCADGSNNGLQIYALLMGDEALARETNVLPGPKQDLYQKVADKAWERVLRDPSDQARKWREFLPDGLPRKATKGIVMPSPYGIKKHSAAGSLRDWMLQHQLAIGERPWGHATFAPANFLNEIVWAEMQALIEPASTCMDWLRSVADACESVRWTNPAGFPITQDYPRQKPVHVRVFIADVPKTVHPNRTLHQTSEAKQRDGLPPNFVHSLDSAALMLTMGRCADRGVRDFAMVHDSYGCPAGDAVTMAQALRETFAEMFQENLLETFHREVSHYAGGADIPEPPARRGLDPSVVLQSKHFFE
jgi:DNA-directed RNA polymerase